MTKVQRYKVGYYSDEWGMSSNTPCLVPDDSGYAVKFEDYCKLEAENERLERNLSTTEQTMREYQELAAKRLEEIAKYRDAPVVAWEFRWLDTNEHTVTSGQLSTWERVMPRNASTTVDDHVAEIQYWINQGYKYELRSLIVKPGEEK